MQVGSLWSWQGIYRCHGTVTRAKMKNPNRAGTDARKRKDGRYETRATLNTQTGRRRVSFYGATPRRPTIRSSKPSPISPGDTFL
jgi:hypothetical protein